MKLLTLDLLAFGPFTDRRLDLSAGQEGLHLVYGPNEAGKSSALRALRDLLFGIPVRTEDDFRHDKQALRVGGRLRNRAGDVLDFVRRKGRKDTVLDVDGQPLGDAALAPFLGAVEQQLFEQRFGIDHARLVSGGQTLLEEHGREAAALFGAALGSGAIHRLLDGLDQEARDLFLPRAAKPRINLLLTELDETVRRQREASLSVRQWQEANDVLEQATARLAAIEAEIATGSAERHRLERIRRTLPGLVRREQLREQLEAIGSVPVLAAGFADQREAAMAKQARAGEAGQNAAGRLVGLRTGITELEQRLALALLAEAAAIDDLRERLGSHRKALGDRVLLAAEQARRAAAAGALLQRVRPDLHQALQQEMAGSVGQPVAGPMPPAVDAPAAVLAQLQRLLRRQRRVLALGEQRVAVQAELRANAAGRTETAAFLDTRRAALAALPPPVASAALERVLDDARRAGDLDQAIASQRVELAQARRNCDQGLAALGHWSGTVAELTSAPFPDIEQVRRFADEARVLGDAHTALQQRRAGDASEQARLDEDLRALTLAGAVPSEADLHAAREHRDQGWRLVRRAWLDGADIGADIDTGADPADADPEVGAYGAEVPLPDAFEAAITDADGVADRLWREAHRVQQRADLQARREACEQRIATTDGELAALAARAADGQAAWLALWAPHAARLSAGPLRPSEMLGWLQRAERLGEMIRQTDALAARLAAQMVTRQVHRGALLRLLDDDAPIAGRDAADNDAIEGRSIEADPGDLVAPTAPDDLSGLIGRAEGRLRALAEIEQSRTKLRDEIATLVERAQRLGLAQQEAQTAVDQWQRDWTALLAELGFTLEASPEQMHDDLQAIAEAVKEIEAEADLGARIAGIDRDATAFTGQARALLRRVAPDLLERPIDEALLQLCSRLSEQRSVQTRLDELRTQAGHTAGEVRDAEIAVGAAAAVLAGLCAQAGVAAPADLPAIEAQVAMHQRLSAELAEVETALLAAGDGLDLAALAAQALGADQDAIVARLHAIEARLEQELRPAQRQGIEAKADADRTLAAMGGDDAAAVLADEAQQLLAAIRADAERYVRIKLAARILRDEIERFRRAHSAPVLRRSSAWLRQLTNGAFSAVETDFDDSDEPVLVARRRTGEPVRVAAMSTGTRDQLYLALRLANLEQYLDAAEPMPFVVDDILIQFDDERARATLAALAELAKRTQVILFTHHGRDLDQARALDPDGERIMIHRLG